MCIDSINKLLAKIIAVYNSAVENADAGRRSPPPEKNKFPRPSLWTGQPEAHVFLFLGLNTKQF